MYNLNYTGYKNATMRSKCCKVNDFKVSLYPTVFGKLKAATIFFSKMHDFKIVIYWFLGKAEV